MSPKGRRYVVLGSSRPALAAAFDLLLHGEAAVLSVADEDPQAAAAALKRLHDLGDWGARKVKLQSQALDLSNTASIRKALKGFEVVVCALADKQRPAAAKAAVEEGLSYCDLGEDLGAAEKILKMNAAARKAGVALVPGCGFVPGLSGILAAYGMENLDICREVSIYAGILPQNRNVPLGLSPAGGLGGLLALYEQKGVALRQGKLSEVEPLSELEELSLGEPLGRLEAFAVAGGAGTGPKSYEGRLKSYDFKTLRWPGHLGQVKSLLQIGFFDKEPVSVEGQDVSPLALSLRLLQRSSQSAKLKDYAVVRVACRGQGGGRGMEKIYDLVDLEDGKTGLAAFDRVAGFTAAVAAWTLAAHPGPKGAFAPELAFKPKAFIDQLRRRGFKIRETMRAAAGA